jgi:hypothetical protein
MTNDLLPVRRLPVRLAASSNRTIVRFFWPGNNERARRIIDRVLSLAAGEASALLQATLQDFRSPHPDLHSILEDHFRQAANRSGHTVDADRERQLLIGSYFTMEYAFESAALFNPSVVPVRQQSAAAPDDLRNASSVRWMSCRQVAEPASCSLLLRVWHCGEN